MLVAVVGPETAREPEKDAGAVAENVTGASNSVGAWATSAPSRVVAP